MTATTALGRTDNHGTSSNPRGIELAVMRLGEAMLHWASDRADRRILSHEEHCRSVTNQRSLIEREHSRALLAARVR